MNRLYLLSASSEAFRASAVAAVRVASNVVLRSNMFELTTNLTMKSGIDLRFRTIGVSDWCRIITKHLKNLQTRLCHSKSAYPRKKVTEVSDAPRTFFGDGNRVARPPNVGWGWLPVSALRGGRTRLHF